MKINLNSLKSLNLLFICLQSHYRHCGGKKASRVYFVPNKLLALGNKTRLISPAVDQAINTQHLHGDLRSLPVQTHVCEAILETPELDRFFQLFQ